jgi:hypothetical protein
MLLSKRQQAASTRGLADSTGVLSGQDQRRLAAKINKACFRIA